MHTAAYKNVCTKKGSEKPRKECDKINCIDFCLEVRQIEGFWKGEERNVRHSLRVIEMIGDLWDKVRGILSRTAKR